MKHSKKYLLITLIVTILILAGCSGNDDAPVGDSPYEGGSKGVIAEFEPLGIEESGIYTIFEKETFPIQVLLKNKGEYDVEAGEVKVVIQGIPLSDFDGITANTKTGSGKLEKISDINEYGGEEIVNFGNNIKYNQDIAGTFYDVNIFASYTYRYKTLASVPKVCFKEDLRDDRVCDVDESKKVFSSAAPIQIQSVKEKPVGAGLLSLEFDVENVGGGRSTLPGQEFAAQYDQIAYTIEPSSEVSKWTCITGGRENSARLAIDGKTTIRCKLNTPLEGDALYTKQIGLTLTYDYKDIIQETVRIKKTI